MLLNFKTLFVVNLRAFSLLAKLTFTVLLARVLSAEEFGQWVLVAAIVAYGIFIVGAEIYNVTLRTYIREGHSAVLKSFSAQWAWYAVAYAIVVAAGALLSLNGANAMQSSALIIALILVLEHFSHELHRVAFFSDHQAHANLILLMKTAGWMVPTGIYLWFAPEMATLAFVLQAWLAGAAVAALYGYAMYRGIFRGLRLGYVRNFVERRWNVMRTLTPFLIVAIALRTPLLLDRYLIQHFVGFEQLAAYGYYATFGNGVQAIFDVLILARMTPRLLSEKRSHEAQVRIVVSYMVQSTVFWLLALAALYLAIPYLNTMVGKESFQDAFGLFLALAVGQMVFSLGSVAHYGLYALHRDHQLATGAVVYLVLCLLFFLILIPRFGSYGAAAALGVAATGFLILRMRQLLRKEPVLAFEA